MAGSIALVGQAALLAGAGLVKLAIPDPILDTVAGFAPEIMTIPLPADRKGRIADRALREIFAQLHRVKAVVLGPGMGRSLGLNLLVQRLYTELPMPVVVDADALNALASRDIPLKHQGLRILTPHPGELERLLRRPMPQVLTLKDAESAAVDFARTHRVILVCKGHETSIIDGRQDTGTIHYNRFHGNPGMATAGSGDVLSGILGGLFSQSEAIRNSLPDDSFDEIDLVRYGIAWHARAGDLAAEKLGELSVTAGSILASLPAASPGLQTE